MIKFKLIAALACLSLAACNPPNAEVNNATNGGGGVPSEGRPVQHLAATGGPERCGLAAGTLVDERTLYSAETAYNVPAHAYVTADANGRLSPELKARVRPLLVNAYEHLKLARAAYRLGDVCNLANAVAGVRNFATQASAVIPR